MSEPGDLILDLRGWHVRRIPRWLMIALDWERLEDEAQGLFPAQGRTGYTVNEQGRRFAIGRGCEEKT